jgi:hypothetical protein
LQHFGLLSALLDDSTPSALRAWVPDLVSGRRRSGISLVGLIPGPPLLSATPLGQGGYALSGQSPWVTGWGIVDALLVVARGPDDTNVALVIDAAEGPRLTAEHMHLAAMNASATVRLVYDEFVVPAARVIGRRPHDPLRREGRGLRNNGSLALGVARRALALLGPSPLDAELDRVRQALDDASDEQMATARTHASAFAVQAAHAFSVQHGSRSVLEGDPAERLTREAAALLVFGSRPAIRSGLLAQYGAKSS